MDELRKAKMDLPPPPQPNESPQKPFGVFQEQNFETRVNIHTIIFVLQKLDFNCVHFNWVSLYVSNQAGIRKSTFTDPEKDALQTVILKREQTAKEVAESQVTMNGSNGHLNTGNFHTFSDHGFFLYMHHIHVQSILFSILTKLDFDISTTSNA